MVVREGDLGRNPFFSEIQHTLRPSLKALGVVALTRADVCTPIKLVCCPQGQLVALFWVPADTDTGLQGP